MLSRLASCHTSVFILLYVGVKVKVDAFFLSLAKKKIVLRKFSSKGTINLHVAKKYQLYATKMNFPHAKEMSFRLLFFKTRI